MFLQEQMEKIGDYPDKSLFFQNPQIIEGWGKLVRATEKIKSGYDPESVKEWLQRTDTYVAYLLSMRELNLIFRRLEMDYLEQMKNLIDFYDDWENRECISSNVIDLLSGRQYLGVLKRDITQNYSELNNKLLKARSDEFSALMEINNFLLDVMNQVGQNIMSFNPSFEDFAKAIDNDLREWTLNFGNKLIRDMKEDLTRHYKEHRTDRYTPELWSDLLDADEKALNKAKMQQLAECGEPEQEHWGENMKKQMDENGRLMQQILSSCHTEEFLELGKAEIAELFIPLLTPDNLDMFYEIIVRRSLIQCEMFPELKEQHEAWLNNVKEQSDDSESTSSAEPAKALNYFAPTKNLQELLKQDWFKEVRANEKYDEKWTDDFISALMATQWKDNIAQDWAVTGQREKKTQIKGYVIGLLKDNGVLKGKYTEIAQKVGIIDESRTFSKYMGQGKNQPYADWVKGYVNDKKEG